jgi:hypothetical protein
MGNISIGQWIIGVGVLWLYWLPTIVAALRRAKPVAGIAVVNLFLGWTMIAWVLSLAWALSSEVKPLPGQG